MIDASADAFLVGSPPSFTRRPWGGFSTVAFLGDLGALKIIAVSPSSRLSLQRHERREEHWVVLTGEGFAEVDDARCPPLRGDHVRVPRGAWHRLSNASAEHQLVVAEAEADIQRVEDDYGRAAAGGDF